MRLKTNDESVVVVLDRRGHVGSESFAQGPLVNRRVGQIRRVGGRVEGLKKRRNNEGLDDEPTGRERVSESRKKRAKKRTRPPRLTPWMRCVE